MAVLDQARARGPGGQGARGPGGQGQGRQKGGQGKSEPGAALRGVGLCGDSCLGQGTEQEARALVTDGSTFTFLQPSLCSQASATVSELLPGRGTLYARPGEGGGPGVAGAVCWRGLAFHPPAEVHAANPGIFG